MVRVQLKIHGMDCADEVAVLRRHIGPLVGGDDRLTFDILKGRMSVSVPADTTVEAIVDAVSQTGMRAEPWTDVPATEGGRRQSVTRSLFTAISGVCTVVGFAVHAAAVGGISAALGAEGAGVVHGVPVAAQIVYAVGVVTGVWFILPRAWFALRTLRPDMNLLMTIAVVGAIAIGEWFEAATVSFLFAVSLALETWSVGRARRAVEALLKLTPDTVRLVGPQGYVEVPPDAPRRLTCYCRHGNRCPLHRSSFEARGWRGSWWANDGTWR
jgi:Cd2+/Zn2+-exporting ATPase